MDLEQDKYKASIIYLSRTKDLLPVLGGFPHTHVVSVCIVLFCLAIFIVKHLSKMIVRKGQSFT